MFHQGCALEVLNIPQPSILPFWKLLFVFRPFCLKHGAVTGFRSVEPSTSGSSNLVSVSPVRPEGWLMSHTSPYTCRRPFQVQTKPSWTAGMLSLAEPPLSLHLPMEQRVEGSAMCASGSLPCSAFPEGMGPAKACLMPSSRPSQSGLSPSLPSLPPFPLCWG